MKVWIMTKVVVLQVQGIMFSIVWWKREYYLTIALICLRTIYAVANYLLEQGTFVTKTMRRNQLQHIQNEIVTAKPKVGEKVYYRK